MNTLEEKIQAALAIWDVDRIIVERIATRAEQLANHAHEQAAHNHDFDDEAHEGHLSHQPTGMWVWMEDSDVPAAQVLSDDGDVVKTVT